MKEGKERDGRGNGREYQSEGKRNTETDEIG